MNLEVKYFDNRTFEAEYLFHDVIDKDTGKVVGYSKKWAGGGRLISLFDDKYQAILDSHAACWGFAKGVEAVLTHIVSLPKEEAKSSAA
jgi:hypothetical protein